MIDRIIIKEAKSQGVAKALAEEIGKEGVSYNVVIVKLGDFDWIFFPGKNPGEIIEYFILCTNRTEFLSSLRSFG